MPLTFDLPKKIFKLDTATSSYIFMCAEHDRLLRTYYGARISDMDVAYLNETMRHYLKLAGLNAHLTYRDTETGVCYHGDTLMHAGLQFPRRFADFESVQIHLVAENA